MGKLFDDKLEVLVIRPKTPTFGYNNFGVKRHIVDVVSGEENDDFNKGSVAPFKRIRIGLRLTDGSSMTIIAEKHCFDKTRDTSAFATFSIDGRMYHISVFFDENDKVNDCTVEEWQGLTEFLDGDDGDGQHLYTTSEGLTFEVTE